MNAGAEAAAGDILCFLHADTLPPADLVRGAAPGRRRSHTPVQRPAWLPARLALQQRQQRRRHPAASAAC
jgi:hypothetical protein